MTPPLLTSPTPSTSTTTPLTSTLLPLNLLSLPDDVWLALSHHLLPCALYNLLHVSPCLTTRLLPLLPTLLRPLSPSARHAALVAALQSLDKPLVRFLLLAPGLPPLPPKAQPYGFLGSDPILAARLPPPLAFFIAGEFARSTGSVNTVLEVSASLADPLVLAAAALSRVASPSTVARLAQRLTLSGRGGLAMHVLSCDARAAFALAGADGCSYCEGRHTLLHAAAGVGDAEVVKAVVEVMGERVRKALKVKDCTGETPLGIAIMRRKSRVAQMLVRCGAEVRDLVGCAGRGGGALEASEVWFKPVVDVD